MAVAVSSAAAAILLGRAGCRCRRRCYGVGAILTPIRRYRHSGMATVAAMQTDPGVTLIIATTADVASINPARKLLARGLWNEGAPVEGNPTWRLASTRLWQLSKRTLDEDHLDERWKDATGESVQEAIFLSRHVASSGTPALTLHPIGVPHLRPGDEVLAGGKAGRAVPPSPRLGAWLRLLKSIAEERKLTPEFEVTFEATHHGPHLESPSMFVEIGSTEDYWGREDAAEAIADLVWRGLGLDGQPAHGDWFRSGGPAAGNTQVLLGLGGGHYAPRHQDVAKKEGVWVGHLLPAYAIAFDKDSEGNDPDWHRTVLEVYEATKFAFPSGQVVAHVDEKSFKAPHRKALKEYLLQAGIEARKPNEFVGALQP
eukprot:jgi/Chlat1/9051/Chrsp94S08312